MTDVIRTLDLSPLDDLDGAQHQWLEQLQHTVVAGDHLLSPLGTAQAEDTEEIVSRDRLGRWWTGRYIGDISLDGRRLEIRPRLGQPAVEQWLGDALNLVIPPESATHRRSESFIARLLALVWCRAVDRAARHGPPSFRCQHHHEGLYLRGRLDVQRTVRLRAGGTPHVASVAAWRDLDNPVVRALVAAERALTSRIGDDRWHTPRVREMLPALTGAVGARPTLPALAELRGVRYTPITRPYRQVADLSWRLASSQGSAASGTPGRAEGLLLDMAELWEIYVVRCLERALPTMRVEHGTRSGDSTWLLRSALHPSRGLGRLKPDALVWDGERLVLVADAKYKRLVATREHPQGLHREDLYQLSSYLARFAPAGEAPGALLYPREAGNAARPMPSGLAPG